MQRCGGAGQQGDRPGQAVTIDNKPGAGATLGASALARSPADGYMLMLGSIVDYAITPPVHKSLPFDQQRDFIPVLEIDFGTVGLIVHADLPARNVALSSATSLVVSLARIPENLS